MNNQPNIICIILDHVTFMHYKLMTGAKPVLNTYEKLAENGAEFLNAKSSHPLCLPCRASMLTGVYAHKHGKIRNGGYKEKDPFELDNLIEDDNHSEILAEMKLRLTGNLKS